MNYVEAESHSKIGRDHKRQRGQRDKLDRAQEPKPQEKPNSQQVSGRNYLWSNEELELRINPQHTIELWREVQLLNSQPPIILDLRVD